MTALDRATDPERTSRETIWLVLRIGQLAEATFAKGPSRY